VVYCDFGVVLTLTSSITALPSDGPKVHTIDSLVTSQVATVTGLPLN
jgi:hypothetical protein